MSLKELMQQNDDKRLLIKKERQKNFETKSKKLLDILLETGCIEFLKEIRDDLWKIGDIDTSTGKKYSTDYAGEAKVFLKATWLIYVPEHEKTRREYDYDESWNVPAGIEEVSEIIEISFKEAREWNETGDNTIDSKRYHLNVTGSNKGTESIEIENFNINELRSMIQPDLVRVYKKYYNNENVPHICKAKAEKDIEKAIIAGELDSNILQPST